mgnify:CR=1 FL=1
MRSVSAPRPKKRSASHCSRAQRSGERHRTFRPSPEQRAARRALRRELEARVDLDEVVKEEHPDHPVDRHAGPGVIGKDQRVEREVPGMFARVLAP